MGGVLTSTGDTNTLKQLKITFWIGNALVQLYKSYFESVPVRLPKTQIVVHMVVTSVRFIIYISKISVLFTNKFCRYDFLK